MYAATRGPRPVSLGASLLISGGIISALVFISPDFVPHDPPPPLIAGTIEAEKFPPPPKPEVKPETKTPRESKIVTPDPVIRPLVVEPTVRGTPEISEAPPTPLVGKPEGTALTVPVTEPAPPPALISARPDPRYAGDIQPPYPAARERAGDEGIVRVRIRIGADGRVKEVIQLDATHNDFWEATRRHVLAKWRFKPATRGGIPEESWKVMSLKFEIKG